MLNRLGRGSDNWGQKPNSFVWQLQQAKTTYQRKNPLNAAAKILFHTLAIFYATNMALFKLDSCPQHLPPLYLTLLSKMSESYFPLLSDDITRS